MKNLTKTLLMAFLAIISSCTKEGATGPAGNDGNANVILYRFEDNFTFTTSTRSKEFMLTESTSGQLDSSLVLGFYKQSGCTNWEPSQGIGHDCGGVGAIQPYVLNSYVNSNGQYFSFAIKDLDGTVYSGANITYTDFKIIVIPPSVVIDGRTRDPKTMSYDELCDLYNIRK